MRLFQLIAGCIFIYPAILCSQVNLVPNYSFENYSICPNNFSQISYSSGWNTANTATPDYFNACANIPSGISVPTNTWGFENAKTGSAYAGIYSWIGFGSYTNYREYIQIQLGDSLIAGIKYSIAFYVSLADSMQYACNNIGAYFSQTSIIGTNTLVLPFMPQVSNNPLTNLLTNKIGWTLVSDTIVATGGEKYVVIGNFVDDSNIDTLFTGGASSMKAAFYYIDDIKVSKIDSLEGILENSSTSNLSVYPNPATGEFWIKTMTGYIANCSVTIYNLLGEKLYEEIAVIDGPVQVSPNLEEGSYFITIKANNNNFKPYNGKITIIK